MKIVHGWPCCTLNDNWIRTEVVVGLCGGIHVSSVWITDWARSEDVYTIFQKVLGSCISMEGHTADLVANCFAVVSWQYCLHSSSLNIASFASSYLFGLVSLLFDGWWWLIYLLLQTGRFACSPSGAVVNQLDMQPYKLMDQKAQFGLDDKLLDQRNVNLPPSFWRADQNHVHQRDSFPKLLVSPLEGRTGSLNGTQYESGLFSSSLPDIFDKKSEPSYFCLLHFLLLSLFCHTERCAACLYLR